MSQLPGTIPLKLVEAGEDQLPGTRPLTATLSGIRSTTQTSVDFFGRPNVDPEASKPIRGPMVEQAIAENTKQMGRFKLGQPDPANPYPDNAEAMFGSAATLPGTKPLQRNTPPKATPAYPYNEDVIAAQYPELMPKIEKRNLASELGMAILRPIYNLGMPDTGMMPGLRNIGASRDDTAGTVANALGGFVPGLATGPIGPGIFAAESYKRTLNRSQSGPAAIGAGLLSMGLGMVPTGEMTKNPQIANIVNRLGGESKARKYLVDKAVEAILVGGTGAAMPLGEEGLARAGGATPHEVHVGESIAGMMLAHYGLKAVGVIRSKDQKLVAEAVRQKFLQNKLVTADEAAIIGPDNPRAYLELASRRASGEKVTVENIQGPPAPPKEIAWKVRVGPGAPRIGIVSEGMDSVPWKTQVRLGHDPVVIDLERQRLAEGGKPWLIDKSGLPPTPEEISTARLQLQKSKSELEALLQPPDLTATGAPVTQRALVLNDIRNHLETLGDSPTRLQVEQAEALVNKVPKVINDLEPIPEHISTNTLNTKELQSLTPEDMTPVQRINYPLPEAESKGYFKPVEELASDPQNQHRLAAARRGALERYRVLNDQITQDPVIKIMMAKQLDAEYQLAVEKILEKDTTPTAAKVKARERVRTSKLNAKGKIDALTVLDRAFESIAARTSNETARGMIERLKVELADHPALRDLLEGEAWDVVIGRHSYSHANDWAKTEQTVRRAIVEKLARGTQEQIVNDLKLLSEDARKSFAGGLAKAKDVAQLKAVGEAIKTAADVQRRANAYAFIKRTTAKLEKSFARDAIIARLTKELTPPPKAKGQEVPETVGRRAMKIDGKVYEGRAVTDKTFEELHASIITRIRKENPELSKTLALLQVGDTNDPAFGFVTSKGRYVTRDEAQKISQGSTVESSNVTTGASGKSAPSPTKTPLGAAPAGPTLPQAAPAKDSRPSATPKPAARLNPSTGKTTVDWKATEKALDTRTNDQVLTLENDLRQIAREAQLKSGLMNRYRKFSEAEVVKNLESAIRASAPELTGPTSRPIKHFLKNVADSVTTEGWLAQMGRFDRNNPFYRVFHEDLIPGHIRHEQNSANTRRYLTETTLKLLGFDYSTQGGKRKLGAYLLEPVAGKVTRGEALNALLVSEDPGRQDSHKVGIIKAGKTYTVGELTKGLTAKELEWARSLRSYFPNNPFAEKAFSTYDLLNGYSVQRTGDHWISSRSPLEKAPKTDFNTFKVGIERTVDPLRDRQEGVTSPYEAKDILSEFLRASDELSLFGELGLNLYKASTAINNPRVVDAMTSHWGKDQSNRVNSYLSDIMGSVGIQRDATTEFANHIINTYALSKIGLNAFSASKQTLDVLTFAAEGTLSLKSLSRAVAEGAWLSKRVKRDMLDSSGMAYQRYNGHYLDNIAVMSENNRKPSLMQSVQHHSLIMQRTIDKSMLSIAWRAAEIEAQTQGLKGLELKSKTSELFHLVVGRAQPTSNPLYSGELEVAAKRQPLLRSGLVFMRAPNRIYNVVRRRVVEATQNPSPENVRRAGQAIMFGVIGNTIGIVGINAIRRAAYNQDTDETRLATDSIDSLSGMYYLGSPAGVIVESLFDNRAGSDRMAKSPIFELFKDAYDTFQHTRGLVTAGDDLVTRGPNRGQPKQDQEFDRLLDSAFSLTGGVTGLPIWGVWTQARGLYRWTEPQQRLMVEFEQEKRQLKSDGRESSPRYQQLEKTQRQISEYHRKRAAGLATQAETQRAIEDELRRSR